MSKENYLKDITAIKDLMNRSSRFISLSGLSGVLAGIYALAGATYAYWLFNQASGREVVLEGDIFRLVLLDLILVGILSVGTAIFLTTQKAKKNGEKIWDPTTRRLLLNFLTPLIAGGIYILIILNQHRYGQTAALMLLFYGLGLVSASKYTLGYIKYLGFTEIILGLICAIYPGYGFWFWVIGFGIMHIVYGILMYFKYERE